MMHATGDHFKQGWNEMLPSEVSKEYLSLSNFDTVKSLCA